MKKTFKANLISYSDVKATNTVQPVTRTLDQLFTIVHLQSDLPRLNQLALSARNLYVIALDSEMCNFLNGLQCDYKCLPFYKD